MKKKCEHTEDFIGLQKWGPQLKEYARYLCRYCGDVRLVEVPFVSPNTPN